MYFFINGTNIEANSLVRNHNSIKNEILEQEKKLKEKVAVHSRLTFHLFGFDIANNLLQKELT